MEQTLRQLGLDDTEARVYFAMLKLGPATVTEITKEAGITRTLGYHVLDKLCQYNLTKEVSRETSRKKQYVAEHPSQLLKYVEERKLEWERKVVDAERQLPNLLSLYKIGDKPTVLYEEGLEGIKTIYLESLQASSEVISIVDLDSFDDLELRTFFKNCAKVRLRNRVRERHLILDTHAARTIYREVFDDFQLPDCKWVDPEKLTDLVGFGGMLSVFEQKAMITIIPRPDQAGMILESTVLTKVLKSLFELAWTVGEPVQVTTP